MKSWLKAFSAAAALLGIAACEQRPSSRGELQSRAAVVATALAVSPAALEFNAVVGGATSAVTLTNTGAASLTISSIALCAGTSAEFSVVAATPITLAPGATLIGDVTYAPMEDLPYSVPTDFNRDVGCLTVMSDDPSSPALEVALSGQGMSEDAYAYCTQCHGSRTRHAWIDPAPPRPVHTSGQTSADARIGAHQEHLLGGAYTKPIECSECHPYAPAAIHPSGMTELIWGALATGRATLAPEYARGADLLAPATCSSVYCHGATLAGGTNKTPIWNQVDGSQAACGTCHGVPPPGPAHVQSTACGGCHEGYTATSVNLALHVNGVIDTSGCTSCHGDSSRTPVALAPAPPKDTKDNVVTTAAGVGAHQQHLTGTALRANPVACTDCHTVPTSLVHSTQPLDLTWSPLATTGGLTPSYDSATNTCASNYCHGATLAGGTNTRPAWTRVDGSQAACGTCHGRPPAAPHPTYTDCEHCHLGYTYSSVNPVNHINGRLDVDTSAACGTCHGIPPVAPHTTSTTCGTCHPGYTSTSVNATTHMDGVIEVSGTCSSCHGDPTRASAALAPAPPVDTKGNTAMTARGVGAHQAHLTGGTMRNGIGCNECHNEPSTMSHTNGVVDIAWGLIARARNNTPTWNGTSCTNYCHGSTLGSGSNHAPVWTTVNGTQDACGTCHGAATTGRPSTGRHTSESHHSSRPCTDCHAGTASPDKALHVDGLVNMKTTLNWNATSRSCSPSCHGGESWGGTAYTIPATLYASPGTITFGDANVGSTVSQPVTIQNHGTASLTVSGLAMCAGTSSEFTLSTAAGFTLASGASQTITVSYRPTAGGNDVGCFTIASSDTAHNPTTVNLTGIGVPLVAQISATPKPLDFGSVYAGASSTRTLTVSNPGNTPLSVTSAGVCAGTTAGFSVSPSTLTVAAGATGTLSVTFLPAAPGVVAAQSCVSLVSNAAPSPYEVPLTGTALASAPIISVTPSPLAFGTVSTSGSTTKPLTVSNSGTANLNVEAGLCAGTTAGFSLSPATLWVAPGATGTVSVTFAPTAAGTVAPESCVSLTSNDAARSPYQVPLSGTAVVAAPIISATPNPLAFGTVNTGTTTTRTLTVSNTGTATLTVQGALCAGTTAGFSVTPTTLSVAPGAAGSLSVTFAPTVAGTVAAGSCVALTSNDDSQNPYAVPLTGAAVTPTGPIISATPNPLAFGDVATGSSRSLTVTVTNAGTGTLSVSSIARCSGTSYEFSVSSSSFSLAAGATRSVSVTYQPSAAGADSGCIAFASNDGAHNPYNVTVSGNGVATATHRWQISNGSSVGGLTTNWSSSCGSQPTITSQRITTMNTSSFGCSSDRLETTQPGSATTPFNMLLLVDSTAYAAAKTVQGTSSGTVFSLRNSGGSGTVSFRFTLGYVLSGAFTALGSTDVTNVSTSQTTYPVNLSGVSGTAPSGSRLALRVSLISNSSGNAARVYLGSSNSSSGTVVVTER